MKDIRRVKKIGFQANCCCGYCSICFGASVIERTHWIEHGKRQTCSTWGSGAEKVKGTQILVALTYKRKYLM